MIFFFVLFVCCFFYTCFIAGVVPTEAVVSLKCHFPPLISGLGHITLLQCLKIKLINWPELVVTEKSG